MLFLSLAFAVPAALVGPASSAAAGLGAPEPGVRPGADPLRGARPARRRDQRPHRHDRERRPRRDRGRLRRQRVGAGRAVAAAVRFHQRGATWEVDTGPGCAGPWTQVSANQTHPGRAGGGGLLTLCVAGGSPTVHGTLTAVYNSLGQARTVNTLPLEQYVADTVPGESPSGWATLGGAGPQGMDWGFQELEAQAVAVRSYVLANLGATAATPTPATSPARPTAASSTRRRRAWPPPTTRPAR